MAHRSRAGPFSFRVNVHAGNVRLRVVAPDRLPLNTVVTNDKVQQPRATHDVNVRRLHPVWCSCVRRFADRVRDRTRRCELFDRTYVPPGLHQ